MGISLVGLDDATGLFHQFLQKDKEKYSLLQYCKRQTDVGFCLTVRDITNINNDEPIKSITSFYDCGLLWVFPSGERMRLQTDQLTQKEGLWSWLVLGTQDKRWVNTQTGKWMHRKRQEGVISTQKGEHRCSSDVFEWQSLRGKQKEGPLHGSHQAVMRLEHKDWVGSKHHCSPDTDVWGKKGKDKEEPSSSSVSFCVLVSLPTLSCSMMAEGSAQALLDQREASWVFHTHLHKAVSTFGFFWDLTVQTLLNISWHAMDCLQWTFVIAGIWVYCNALDGGLEFSQALPQASNVVSLDSFLNTLSP